MLFNSIKFILFLPIVSLMYFASPHKYRWGVLLLASYYFYMSWKPEYIILILVSTLIDFFIAKQIYKYNDSLKIKKRLLLLSVISNLTILISFKYFNFFSDNIEYIFSLFSLNLNLPYSNLLLPVGISFYTFQTMSYTIDVYRNKIKPETNLGIFALFVSFFPQLVAGPIERAKNLLPQLKEKRNFDYIRITDGLKLILWGLFKKVVIADRLAIFVNQIYNNVENYHGFPIVLATLFFSFQIYCDFSGYTDIAIGSAKILGINLMDNFKRPYHSKSVAEFWRRWHISLSTWFQDYVFTPLYLKISKTKYLKNINHKKKHFISFFISIVLGEALLGLWHGANWTFVLFGVYYGFLITIYYLFRKKYDCLPKYFRILLTFIIVNIGWIFFRSNSISDVYYIFTNLFPIFTVNIIEFSFFTIGKKSLIISLSSILFLEIIHAIQRHNSIRHLLNKRSIVIRWSVYMILIYSILLLGTFGGQEFIYFKF